MANSRRWTGFFGRSLFRSLLIVGGLALVFASVAADAEPASAANPPTDFAEVLIANELFLPISMTATPDGRILVLLDAGEIRVIKNDQLLPTPMLNIKNKVDDEADRGLQSIALDNNFAQNGYIYLVYTFDSNGVDDGVGNNRLVRYTVNGDVASNEVVLFDNFPAADDTPLHYGGAVEHGSDGKLYVTVGDYLLGANGQDRTNIKGSVLRLNTNGTIPTDNPFYNQLTGDNRAIYAYGLRNPWQTAEHPTTGEIFISDVGADTWEELNVLASGANYGWFLSEGPKDPNDPAQAGFTDPLWAFRHADNAPNDPLAGCAIVGGAFYAGGNQTFPAEYSGKYFTGDYCTGRIVVVDPANGQAENFMDGFNFGLVDMVVNPVNGDLYYIDQTYNDDDQFPRGGVGKITYVGNQTDITITRQPTDVSIAAGSTASFFVGATAPGDVTYQWLRNGTPIPGATDATLTLNNVGQGDNFDRFRVDVSNGQQTLRSDPAVLRITNNTAPQPSITISGGLDGGEYRAGRTISFSGAASDAEDGNLPGSSLRWEIRLNHDDHDHEIRGGVTGSTGTFSVPPSIETSTNVWITVYLTATDSDGTSTTVTRRIDPKIVNVTLRTNPAGLDVSLDGQLRTTDFTFQSVAGVLREVSAPTTQTVGGSTYEFSSWSDGRGQNQARPTPIVDRTWTARYNLVGGGGGNCTVAPINGGVRISWTDKPGTEVLRTAAKWIATPAVGTTSYDYAGGTVNDGWRIRRSGVDEVCDVEGGGGGGPTCTATEENGGVRLTWDAAPTQNRYPVRKNGSWVKTVVDATTTTVSGSLNDTFIILYNSGDGNGKQPLTCGDGGNPPPNDTCWVATRPAGGVTITWQNKQGTEVLRDATKWIATPPAGTLTYDAPNGDLNDGWRIRRPNQGPDEICVVVN